MEAIRVVTDISQHVDCSGLMVTSQEATQYILAHEGLEANIAGAEMSAYIVEKESDCRPKWRHQTNSLRSGQPSQRPARLPGEVRRLIFSSPHAEDRLKLWEERAALADPAITVPRTIAAVLSR